eukprot:XP_001708749.1 Hypothetical protein GL50803_36699 [Giardia lamblia ATCC 50803]
MLVDKVLQYAHDSFHRLILVKVFSLAHVDDVLHKYAGLIKVNIECFGRWFQ